jgi:hypothetical protein
LRYVRCIFSNGFIISPSTLTRDQDDKADNFLGYDGDKGVARVCPIDQGAKLTFLWRTWADGSKPGSIDSSHKGPCAVYMKSVNSAITDVGHGSGWFKIWESGYSVTTK